MINELVKRQYNNQDIEFPIGYVIDDDYVTGQIIRYYYNAESLKNICIKEDLSGLQKVIYRDDDSLHNLFLVYLEILDKIEKLFANGISYLDIHAGNFVIFNNEIKIIDFDSKLIEFSKIRFYQNWILGCYMKMIEVVNEQFGINSSIDCFEERTFSNIKRRVKKLENVIRREGF